MVKTLHVVKVGAIITTAKICYKAQGDIRMVMIHLGPDRGAASDPFLGFVILEYLNTYAASRWRSKA